MQTGRFGYTLTSSSIDHRSHARLYVCTLQAYLSDASFYAYVNQVQQVWDQMVCSSEDDACSNGTPESAA